MLGLQCKEKVICTLCRGENTYLLTCLLPKPNALNHNDNDQEQQAVSEESWPLRSAWVYFCTFQLFIRTRMFHGLIETTVKIGYTYFKLIPHTSNNHQTTLTGPSPGTMLTRDEVQALSLSFFLLLSNSIGCLWFTDTHSKPSLVNSESLSPEVLPITPLRIFTQGLFAMLRNLSSF